MVKNVANAIFMYIELNIKHKYKSIILKDNMENIVVLTREYFKIIIYKWALIFGNFVYKWRHHEKEQKEEKKDYSNYYNDARPFFISINRGACVY